MASRSFLQWRVKEVGKRSQMPLMTLLQKRLLMCRGHGVLRISGTNSGMGNDRGLSTSRRARRKSEAGGWELREGIRARIAELQVRAREKQDEADNPREQTLAEAVMHELAAAEDVLGHVCPLWRRTTHLAVAQTHVDMAQCILLRLMTQAELLASMPGLLMLIREHLAEEDPRRHQVEQIAKRADGIEVYERETLVDATWAARLQLQREVARAGSFVHTVYNVSVVLAFLAFVVAALAAVKPDFVPLCFEPGITVCPTESAPVGSPEDVASAADYTVVEICGLVAAAVAAAVSLRGIKGTSSPYNVSVALAVLKLPTGALTAVIGLLLMRAGFVPGLSALDSSAQIIGYAIVFGYAQQVATRLVDKQGQTVLEAIGDPVKSEKSSA